MYLARAKRVLVLGSSAAGKSTLSAKIEAKLGLPHISYDRDIRWLSGWTVRPRVQQVEIVTNIVARESWVIDGTTVSTLPIRLPRTDLVIWMRPPRLRAIWQLAKRVWRGYGKVRPDMAEGCPEILPDWEFLSYIWTFERKQCPRILRSLDTYGPDVPVYIIRRNSQTTQLMARLEMDSDLNLC